MMKNKKFWQVLKFINQWQSVPVSFAIQWFSEDAIAEKVDLSATNFDTNDVCFLLSMTWILLSCIYQFAFGFSVDKKLEKIIESIDLENTKFITTHSALDKLRDRLIFEDDNRYWEVLEGLAEE